MSDQDLFDGNKGDNPDGNPDDKGNTGQNVFEKESGGDNPLDRLVGEGQKYKTVEELAKAYSNAENFIEQLKEESKEQRETIEELQKTAQGSEKLMERLDDLAAKMKSGGDRPGEESTAVSKEDIKGVLQELEGERKLESNLEQVQTTLLNQFDGNATEASKFIAEKSKELGMEPDKLRDVALQSPEAFFRLSGLDTGGNTDKGTGSRGSTGTMDRFSSEYLGADERSRERNWQYYQKLRKENPTEYFKPSTRRQLMEDRKRLGEKFYS